jgi:eukaryotic-like serine/threonine-protein kinase
MHEFAGFEIIAELGRGTTGVVYEARDEGINRRVALKMALFGADSQRSHQTKQFICEARVLAGLTHRPDANIPTIYALAECDGQPFYIREFVDGLTLERLATTQTIDLRSGVQILKTIAEALQRVHALGFAHRNLHPSNILVAADDCPKLIGFGRCAPLEGTTTAPKATGTPVEVDVRSLQQLLNWLCAKLAEPVPADLFRARDTDLVASPAAFAELLGKNLQNWTM